MEKVLENNHIDDSRREIWKFSEKSGRTARHPFAIRHLQGAVMPHVAGGCSISRGDRIEYPESFACLRPSEVRARIIDGSRSKNGNLGLASGGIRPRIVGCLRKEHLNIG